MLLPHTIIQFLLFLALFFQTGSCANDEIHNTTAGIAVVTVIGVLVVAVYLTGCIVAWKKYPPSQRSAPYSSSMESSLEQLQEMPQGDKDSDSGMITGTSFKVL